MHQTVPPEPSAKVSLGIRLRSLLFVALTAVLAIVHSLPCLAAAPFLRLKQRSQMVNLWTRASMWLLKHLNGVDIEVEGREHVPLDRPVVAVANHQSPWETFYLQLVISPQATILKRELLWIPFFGWGLALLRPIPIDRARGIQALKTILKVGRKRLDQGVSVVIYPEGTRQPPGRLGPFTAGGAMLAAKAGVDLLPIAHNSGDCWPGRSTLRLPGTIRLRIGPPIPVAGRSPKALTAAAEAWIHAHYPGPLASTEQRPIPEPQS